MKQAKPCGCFVVARCGEAAACVLVVGWIWVKSRRSSRHRGSGDEGSACPTASLKVVQRRVVLAAEPAGGV